MGRVSIDRGIYIAERKKLQDSRAFFKDKAYGIGDLL